MKRETLLSLVLLARAAVTVPPALRASLLQGVEVSALHLFFLIDVGIRPAAEGVGRESPWHVKWGKILMLSLVYLPVYFDGTPRKSPWIAASLGTAVTILGAGLALNARLRLGRMAMPIVTTVEDAALCREGVYRPIRHPIYSGFSLAFLGHQISFMFLPGLIVWALFIVTFIRVRIRLEEGLLVEQFGTPYGEYQRNSWKMFPFIY